LSLQKRDKKPSRELVSVIRQSAKALVNFAELWKKVQDKGYAEGFDEKELQEMVRPYLKQRLTTAQIKYLFEKSGLL
jgi:hemolysin activation/secretion protein